MDASTIPGTGIRHRFYWALFLGTLAVLAFVIRWHVRQLDSEVRREGLSNAAVVACSKVLIDHLDVETGLRGHLTTGQIEFLRPYHEGLGRIEVDMATLRVAVASSSEERACYDAIKELSRFLLDEFSVQVSMVDSAGVEDARQRFMEHPTKPVMDKIRSAIFAIQAVEYRRLVENMTTLERSLTTTIFLIDAFVFVLIVLLIAMATGFINPPASLPKHPKE